MGGCRLTEVQREDELGDVEDGGARNLGSERTDGAPLERRVEAMEDGALKEAGRKRASTSGRLGGACAGNEREGKGPRPRFLDETDEEEEATE